MAARRPLSALKSALVAHGSRPRRIPLGLYAGLNLEIDLASQTQLYLGLWERETHPFLRRAIATSRWLVDVGAGSGELVLAFLRDQPAGRAWAIEPSEAGRRAIERNLALNADLPAANVTMVSELAGVREGPGVVRLDRLPLPTDAPGLVKIDVDGAEMDVLRGAEGLLQRADVQLLIETHAQELEEQCLALLGEHGYRCEIVRNAWWRAIVPEHRPGPHNRWLVAWRERDRVRRA